MRASKTIILASNNRHKLSEFEGLLKPFGNFELKLANSFIRNASKLSTVETHDEYLENALAKARTANWASHYPSLGDDSGLEVMALEGAPGVRSHRYAIPKAGQSQDEANIQKLLEALKGKSGEERKARFVCSLALVMEGIEITAEGVLNGTIAETPFGEEGFGYDPIFIPENKTVTLSQLTQDEKNQISHRAKAVHALMDKVQKNGVLLAKP